MTHIPDFWEIIKVTNKEGRVVYRLFGSWAGSYLGSASWRINSGIDRVTREGVYWLFHGASGSIYRCHQNAYGAHWFGASALQGMINNFSELKVEVLEDPPEDMLNFNWTEQDVNQS